MNHLCEACDTHAELVTGPGGLRLCPECLERDAKFRRIAATPIRTERVREPLPTSEELFPERQLPPGDRR